ncbi:MAG TPA: magnesium/cobalt transporter CorA [Blastocatellia bacterium]|nr:magnesium/cobalt transporter CorA [Blastocatellia bacterium]
MIKTLVLDRSSKSFTRVGDPHRISDLCSEQPNIVWVDVSDPTAQDFEDLAREFELHPLSIEDCQLGHQRPKIEEYQGYYFIVLYEAELVDRTRLELRELNIFLGKNYLITVHSQPLRVIPVAEKLWRGWTDLAERGTGLLTYLLIDAIVDDYMPMLDSISDHLEDLEEEIFEDFRTDTLKQVFRIKKQLLFLRRAVVPLRDVFNTLLRREQDIFSRETMVYFQDVYDHLIRIADMIDTLREIVSGTVDAYLSISGNRMNQVMKRLTSISAILMSVTLVAGIYGMNFQFMPELGWRYGYVGALAAMLVIALALYFYFRKIDWL